MPTIQNRRATAAQWTAANSVLAAGEIGFELDTNSVKIGDGLTPWKTLPYLSSGSATLPPDPVDPDPEDPEDPEIISVSAPAPTWVPNAESGGGTWSTGATTGVIYSAPSGTASPGQTITITATAAEGYVLVGTVSWTHTFPEDPEAPNPPALITLSSHPQAYDLEVQQLKALHRLWDLGRVTSPTKVQEYINTALAQGPLAAYTGIGEVTDVSVISSNMDGRINTVRSRYPGTPGYNAASALITTFNNKVKNGEIVL